MAFRGGINPDTTSGTTPAGTTNRMGLTSPFVPATNGTAVTTPGRPTIALSPVGAGLFGGINTESTRAAELREHIEAAARRAQTFHPPSSVDGPLFAPEYELGLPQPVGDMPKEAAARFFAALQELRVP